MSDSYKIHLPQFEGPFDLLLFFIERDELDIYDIPIAKITDEFVTYLHQLEHLDIEMASEFLLVAATLMRIKAKMLLPRKEVDESGKEIDPRIELVERLIEYRKFKDVVEEMQWMEQERQKWFRKGSTVADAYAIQKEFEKEAELHSLTMFKLLESFQKVLQKFEENKNKPQHIVVQYAYTVKDEKIAIKQLLFEAKPISFKSLFETCRNKIHAIFRFLALLELIQLAEIFIEKNIGKNQFTVCASLSNISIKDEIK